jgi:hypothetical protein
LVKYSRTKAALPAITGVDMEVPRIPFKVQCEGAEELYIAVPEEEVGGVELAALVIHHPTRVREGEREREWEVVWVRGVRESGGYEGGSEREGGRGVKGVVETRTSYSHTSIILTHRTHEHTPDTHTYIVRTRCHDIRFHSAISSRSLGREKSHAISRIDRGPRFRGF